MKDGFKCPALRQMALAGVFGGFAWVVHADILSGWMAAIDAEGKGRSEEWMSRPRDTAVPAKVPGFVQDTFPDFTEGTAWYWCRFKGTAPKADEELAVMFAVPYVDCQGDEMHGSLDAPTIGIWRCGKGRVILNAFRVIREVRGNPVAERLTVNLLRCALR